MASRPLILATLVVLVLALAAGTATSGAAEDAGKSIASTERPDGAFDLRYRSLGIDGELVEQTAVLWLPSGEPSGHVVAWGHATTGLADGCAPSAGRDPYVPGLGSLLHAGHVVVAPDYEGLGSGGEHPYLVGASEGRSVLDAIRAARSVAGADGRSAVFGWSQGGHAALFAARMADRYAPDVRLTGIAALAPVTDMHELLDGRSVFANYPGFVAMVAAGYATAYDELDVAQVLPEAGKATAVARRSCTLDAVVALEDARTTVPGLRWERRLRQNDPTLVGLDVPALLIHGEQDRLLGIDDAIGAYGRLCDRGSTVRLERIADADHGTLPILATDAVVEWLQERLDGQRLTGCAQRRT